MKTAKAGKKSGKPECESCAPPRRTTCGDCGKVYLMVDTQDERREVLMDQVDWMLLDVTGSNKISGEEAIDRLNEVIRKCNRLKRDFK